MPLAEHMLWLQKKKKSSLCKEAPLQLHKRHGEMHNLQYTEIHSITFTRPKYTNTQIHNYKYTELQGSSPITQVTWGKCTIYTTQKYTVLHLQDTNTQIHKYTNTQIQLHK